MYFVERSKIEKTLIYIEEHLEELGKYAYESRVEELALERIGHVLIEAIIDTGNLMIDGFIMRDPGSYEDIIDILVDEKVIPEQEINAYKEVIQLRKMLVQDYLQLDIVDLKDKLLKNKKVLDQFSTHIRSYLENELGVANAFSRES
ncbi:DUF86 domain-containing protein [Cerasibacillus terrae]|uniref:DUF86 domain-containing protein n=1 Tax=Cerasibacillus terrae TaxID=2498845 RepID=A0A5C8NJ76_9BACI|nr:DUF86 domain-containing protein [Cerasibacillus terrae]TXL58136.1 DUF86 domain-containing protein [Cerasibacillus terrae]